jgi:hypothetical protein
MATQYIHKKYFAVPHDANTLTKMHVRQSNASHFDSVMLDEPTNAKSQKSFSDFVFLAMLPAALAGTFGGELLHRIFG